MPSGLSHRSRGPLALLAYALLALVCAWPHFATLTFPGMTGDPALWIGKASALNPDWLDWVFAADHFTWYRPLAALTFHLNYAVAGLDPLPYRLFDLALHLAAGLLLWDLARTLLPAAPKWIPFAAAALFLAHPCSEEVVPYIARRSYSLATLAGLAALGLAARTEPAHRGRALLSGICLAAALLSNEAALVFTPTALLLLPRPRGARSALGPALLVALPVALALGLRTAVLGGLGGYGEGLAQEGGPAASLASAWSTLTALDGWVEEDAPTLRAGALALGLLSALWVLVAGLLPIQGRNRPEPAAPAGWPLLVWLAGLLALILGSGLWVERQAYFLVPPFVLLVARLAASLAAASGQGRVLARLACIPLALVAIPLFARSPVLRGPSEARMAAWRERRDLLVRIEEDLARVEVPARVHVAFPNMRRRFRTRSHPDASNGPAYLHQAQRHPMLWAQLVGLQRGFDVIDWIYYDRGAGKPTLRDTDTGSGRLEFPAGSEYWMRVPGAPVPTLDWAVWTPGFQVQHAGSDPAPSLRTLRSVEAGRQYVYIAATDSGTLVEVP